MPVKLSALRQRTRELKVTLPEGDVLTVVYAPYKFDAGFLTRMQEPDALFHQGLSDLLVSWDLIDEEDQPWPTSGELFEGLPHAFLLTVYLAVQQDVIPGNFESREIS